MERSRQGGRTEISPPPILSTPPSQKCVGRGLHPSGCSVSRCCLRAAHAQLCVGPEVGGTSPGPLLTLRTGRARQPLTRTPSPHPLAPPCAPLARVTTCLWTQLRLFTFHHRTSAPRGRAFLWPTQGCVPKPDVAPGA